jgi:hypothetical protein
MRRGLKGGKKDIIVREFGPLARFESLIMTRDFKVAQGIKLHPMMSDVYNKYKNKRKWKG